MKKKVFFMKKIRLMLVDDHTLMRDGLKTIFEIEDDFEIVGFASNGREAYEEALKLKPDIILMDIRMEEMNGVILMYHRGKILLIFVPAKQTLWV